MEMNNSFPISEENSKIVDETLNKMCFALYFPPKQYKKRFKLILLRCVCRLVYIKHYKALFTIT